MVTTQDADTDICQLTLNGNFGLEPRTKQVLDDWNWGSFVLIGSTNIFEVREHHSVNTCPENLNRMGYQEQIMHRNYILEYDSCATLCPIHFR